ncbi:hypothetical protein SISSUDRAFT_300708 [Sistotremastrum suecicum HHB10207 ss-3]|uniref:Uncharacterized protein n=1 Tax=Sistotremastrum suecicum HHB10207 ss-3 TaxID=1314776 RepID=A0A165ZF69_9AGAM|nr:hypothetical protein SISSUDRAFT_300708 [Sistotremastrum suecicum HHB10207 ss-3]
METKVSLFVFFYVLGFMIDIQVASSITCMYQPLPTSTTGTIVHIHPQYQSTRSPL